VDDRFPSGPHPPPSQQKPVKKGLATLYHPLILLVGAEGFEPPAPCSQSDFCTISSSFTSFHFPSKVLDITEKTP
jgi:hypothetical protein